MNWTWRGWGSKKKEEPSPAVVRMPLVHVIQGATECQASNALPSWHWSPVSAVASGVGYVCRDATTAGMEAVLGPRP